MTLKELLKEHDALTYVEIAGKSDCLYKGNADRVPAELLGLEVAFHFKWPIVRMFASSIGPTYWLQICVADVGVRAP